MDKIEIIDIDDDEDNDSEEENIEEEIDSSGEDEEEGNEEDTDEEYEEMCTVCKDLMTKKTDRQLLEALVLKVMFLELSLKRMQGDLDEAYSVLIQNAIDEEDEEEEED